MLGILKIVPSHLCFLSITMLWWLLPEIQRVTIGQQIVLDCFYWTLPKRNKLTCDIQAAKFTENRTRTIRQIILLKYNQSIDTVTMALNSNEFISIKACAFPVVRQLLPLLPCVWTRVPT